MGNGLGALNPSITPSINQSIDQVRALAYYPGLRPLAPYHDPDTFNWLRRLRRQAGVIREELDAFLEAGKSSNKEEKKRGTGDSSAADAANGDTGTVQPSDATALKTAGLKLNCLVPTAQQKRSFAGGACCNKTNQVINRSRIAQF